MRRAVLMMSVLALGLSGGALLGGCGGTTKTVSVSGAPIAGATARRQPTAPTTSTAGSPTSAATTPTTSSGESTPTTAQGTSPTRTAPAPAFTKTGTQSAETAANAQAGAAADVVTAHGYTPIDISTYHATHTLRVLIGNRTGSTTGHEQQAFFFLGTRYLGTDTRQPSASIQVVAQNDTEVTLAYGLYRPHDALCCPSGGQATVHFQLNDGQLAPLDPIPPVSSATGLARQ